MAKDQHLKNAPIVEALIDFRVQPRDDFAVDQLQAQLELESFGYTFQAPIYRGSFGLSLNLQEEPAAKILTPEAVQIGFRLSSVDEKYVTLFTGEGFTLSRLAPYQSWDGLLAEVRRLWPIYLRYTGALQIIRVATRFINNLQLPLQPGDKFERYLTLLPQFPDRFPQTLSQFMQRFVLHEQDCGATVIVTLALDQIPIGNKVPVILDVDAYREQRFRVDSDDVWDYLGQLRSLKNRCFFEAITEAAEGLYL